ncbi:amino acid-binding protein [soil metagenome]
MSYLLRLVVSDRPGMLGAVATAIGMTGADIISIDVVERALGYAVDDLVIELAPGGQPDGLITAAQSVPDVRVESVRPFSGPSDTHRELALIDALAGHSCQVAALMADEVPRIFRSGWAVVLRENGVVPFLDATSPAAPGFDGISLPWFPMDQAAVLDPDEAWVPEAWSTLGTAMMAAPLGPQRAVLVGRPGGPEFRPSELLRLAHLAGIAATVADGGRAHPR